jgi:hypothetical protein
MNRSIDSFRCKGRVERFQKKQVGRPACNRGLRQKWQQSNKGPHHVYRLPFEYGKVLILDLPIPVACGAPLFLSFKFQRGTKGIYIQQGNTPSGSHQLID